MSVEDYFRLVLPTGMPDARFCPPVCKIAYARSARCPIFCARWQHYFRCRSNLEPTKPNGSVEPFGRTFGRTLDSSKMMTMIVQASTSIVLLS